jgi:hypothetical protein
MKDLNIIANILCNYYDRRELDPAEMDILCEWLSESQANEDFLTDLSDDAIWIKDSRPEVINDLIRSKLILLYKL